MLARPLARARRRCAASSIEAAPRGEEAAPGGSRGDGRRRARDRGDRRRQRDRAGGRGARRPTRCSTSPTASSSAARRRRSCSARARTAPSTSSRTSTTRSPRRSRAGDVVSEIAPIVGGGGGGRPTMARAGGKDPEKLADALARARELIAAALSREGARARLRLRAHRRRRLRPDRHASRVRSASRTQGGDRCRLREPARRDPRRGARARRRRAAADAARRARRAGAGDARFVERLRAARRGCRSRPTTSASPPSSPAATTRAPPRTCSPSYLEWQSSRALTPEPPAPRLVAVGAARRRRRGDRRRRVALARPRGHHKQRRRRRRPPPPKPFRIVFPEGFTRAQMAAARRRWSRRSPSSEHRGPRAGSAQPAYLAASRRRAVVPCFGKRGADEPRGLPLPGDLRLPRRRRRRSSSSHDQLAGVLPAAGGRSSLAYARSKNLTPYDVLKIASMIEREAAVPAERPLIAAVIYNRLHDRMPLGIDATLRYGLHIPPTQVDPRVAARRTRRRTTRGCTTGLPPTPIANPGLASLQAAAHPAKVDYLYYVRKPDHRHDFFTSSSTAFYQLPLRARLRLLTHARRAARPSGRALALAADAERGVRRRRARLGLRGVRRRGSGRRGRRAA